MDGSIANWCAEYDKCLREYEQLQDSHQWSRGPADLLSIIGRRRRETTHCAVLAWLMDPQAAHGLGARFLDQVLAVCFPTERFSSEELALTHTACEVVRKVPRAESVRGPRRSSRADIIVYLPERQIIFEAKVDHVESDSQCDDLYSAFTAREEDQPLFVFLSLNGTPPTTAAQCPAGTFHALSFKQLQAILQSLTPDDGARGASALLTYLQTLERVQSVITLDERHTFYLQRQEEIDVWCKVKYEVQGIAQRFLDSLEPRFREVGGDWKVDRFGRAKWNRLFFYRPHWRLGSREPIVGIGVEWDREAQDFSLHRAHVVLRLDRGQPEAKRIDAALTANLAACSDLAGFSEAPWWRRYREVTASGSEWWHALDRFAEEIVDAAVDLRDKAAGAVDAALTAGLAGRQGAS